MSQQNISHYELIGKADGVRQLVNRFYELMDSQPETWEIRKMHPEDLQSSRDKLFKFLSGWLGGPQLYVEEYGHPRLRMRHFPFAINSAARDQWLSCMFTALDEQVESEVLRISLKQSFTHTADHMRNTAD